MKAAYVLLLAAAMVGCKKEEPHIAKVKYTVACGSCSLTYENSTGNTEQRGMTGSWYYEFNAYKGGFYYISAQNNSSSGSVTVKILIDGKVEEEATSSGAYCIATASH